MPDSYAPLVSAVSFSTVVIDVVACGAALMLAVVAVVAVNYIYAVVRGQDFYG